MGDVINSVEVAQRLGITLNGLTVYLSRHPHLRPEKRAGTSFVWTPKDVSRLEAYRAMSRQLRRRKEK